MDVILDGVANISGKVIGSEYCITELTSPVLPVFPDDPLTTFNISRPYLVSHGSLEVKDRALFTNFGFTMIDSNISYIRELGYRDIFCYLTKGAQRWELFSLIVTKHSSRELQKLIENKIADEYGTTVTVNTGSVNSVFTLYTEYCEQVLKLAKEYTSKQMYALANLASGEVL